jgi:hypothetical protein
MVMGYIAPLMVWQSKLKDECLKNGKIFLGLIDKAASHAITSQHGAVLLQCYIDPQELVKMASDNGLTPGELLRTQILPDQENIKSGDFGEILARGVIQEGKDNPKFPAYRWRNRAHKNDTVRGPDLIGYVLGGGEPSENDLLIICEVKTLSASINKNVVKNAFEEVRQHYISQLANSLFFIQFWLRRQGQEAEARIYARFTNPHRDPYQKQLVPCVVHESQTWDDKFLEVLPETYQPSGEYKTGESIVVIILCVENLSDWIHQVHSAAIDCAGK